MDCTRDFEKLVMKELETFSSKEELTPADVTEIQRLGEAVDIVKDLYTIEAMKNSEYGSYSGMDGYYMDDGYPMMRGNSYRGGQPMYNRYDRGSSYRGGRMGYMRDGAKDAMVRKLEDMIDMATNDKERNALVQCLEKLEH